MHGADLLEHVPVLEVVHGLADDGLEKDDDDVGVGQADPRVRLEQAEGETGGHEEEDCHHRGAGWQVHKAIL